MKTLARVLMACGLALGTMAAPTGAPAARVGDVVRDFTVVDRATARSIRLGDFAGKIVVLDFFTYWCAPCRQASADLERGIQRYYAARGGNPAGLPVVVVAINLEPGHPDRTDAFVRQAGLELAADDPSQKVFSLFDEQNSLPLIVVINGAAGISGRRQWEVLYRKAGYDGAAVLRSVIDSVGAR